ncbi:Plug domain-containing protein, partial [candidate division KSB1 bacterium]|nr:Plug domain-containing protein [candidate division KSB1 bacterium]
MQGKSLRIIAIGSILWCGLAVSLRSEQVDVPSDSIRYHLDPVVVIASRLAAAQSQAAASVSVIDAGMMQHMEAHSALQAVSDFVPGVFITEKAVMGYGVASGAAGGISIRGVGGSPVTGVLVLRDGRPDMMGLMGHPLPDSYPLQGLERIEVIR